MRRLVLACWIVALLCTQGLGLVHGVLHGPGSSRGAHPVQAAFADHTAGKPAPPFLRLFGHPAHGGDCRLYDHATGTLLAPPLPPICIPALAAVLPPAGWASGPNPAPEAPPFDARAPPSRRT